MRGDVVKKKPSGIYKTLATGLVLSLLVMAAAMIYMLYNVQVDGDKTPFILSFALPFGIPAVAMGAFGIISMSNIDEKKWRIALFVVSAVAALMEAASGALGIALLNNLTIGICLIFIAVCLLGLAITALTSLNDR